SFALIAAMTALVAIGVLSFVWEQHFQAYTRDNLQKQADNVAVSIATKYTNNGGDLRRDGTLSPAESATSLNSGLGIQVIAGGFDPVNESILYDNTRAAEGEGGVSLAPSSRANVVSSPIIAEGTTVGTVRMWVPGSELMLSKGDVMFREQSYQAMIFAAALAIALALGIGFLFARGLVNPINRMTKTAKDIKKGNLSARTGLTGDDEVARLGETFDEMAESIEKDRELERRLTTDVAHELRTPLMAIQSTVEAMVDGVFEANAERLETVNSEVQRLGRLVEALLKLSRLENRSSPMSKEVIDVGDLISGIIATHEAFVADSGLTLRYEREDDVFVCGDADMLRQATANLISNAVRYTPEGGTITVKVTKGDLMACIVVQDTGIGLSPEEIKMVFSRFWRADAGRDRASGGLGIGLAVVKEIVDRHGGWVRVEGKLDEGACFTIYVPLYNEETAKNREKMKFKNKNAS
ncbi:MAG: HAMP domain-containing sensor histidine kinase, partial [Raoultibacter sp.]